MKGFHGNIEDLTKDNDNYRKVLYTGKHLQLVVMSIPVGGDVGAEVHPDNDQFFRVEAGKAKAIIDDNEYEFKEDEVIIIPAGARHNVINASETEDLKLYTLYGPSHHRLDVVQATKEEAEASDEEFDGVTSE